MPDKDPIIVKIVTNDTKSEQKQGGITNVITPKVQPPRPEIPAEQTPKKEN